MNRHLSHGEHRALKDQERRDARAGQRDQAIKDQRWLERRISMTRETIHGHRVENFPDVSDLRERIGELRARLAEMFDEAEIEATRQQRMTATNKADVKRFPVIGDQS